MLFDRSIIVPIVAYVDLEEPYPFKKIICPLCKG
jgi:hypothetical protein